ncbi:uncharacterized protein LOC135940419 [Cloeon dipterum]|uniref:Uncharacterized protein n=1 Tax=Cloeon dipterum TaxID=197152 RepID=A0A8S1BYA6_9INSE|nr:Hypothetical predicted protein [Cloeon dipterum]
MKVFAILICALAAIFGAEAYYQGAQSFFYPGPQFGSGSLPGGSSDVGPVVFPSAPLSSETSGVVPGASGYGFVQPGAGRSFGRSAFHGNW